MNLITGRQLERDLQITPQERQRLDRCHVLPSQGRIGTALAYDGASVESLRSRGEWTPTPPAIAVRLAEPAPDVQPWGRTFSGWDERWDEETKQGAARGVWAVKDGQELIDQNATLVAVVAIVIVGAWRIVGGEQTQGRWRFDVAPHHDAATITNTTLRLGPGALLRTWL